MYGEICNFVNVNQEQIELRMPNNITITTLFVLVLPFKFSSPEHYLNAPNDRQAVPRSCANPGTIV